MEPAAPRGGRQRFKGDKLGPRLAGDTYGNQKLKPYGWMTQTYGITKSDAMREQARQRGRDARARGKVGAVQAKANQVAGLRRSAIANGMSATEAARTIKSLGDYSKAMSKLRSRYERINGKYTRGEDGLRVRRDVRWQDVRPVASAYDIKQITGKRHGQKIAKYLSLLGPKSLGEFIAFDKTYYPPAKGKMTIDEDELLDFIAYSMAPWESANIGSRVGTHWGPRVQGAPDIAKLQKMLIGQNV
jgi:hypothetical protein